MKVGDLIEVYSAQYGWRLGLTIARGPHSSRADLIKVLINGVVETSTTLYARDIATQIGAANNRKRYKTTSRQA